MRFFGAGSVVVVGFSCRRRRAVPDQQLRQRHQVRDVQERQHAVGQALRQRGGRRAGEVGGRAAGLQLEVGHQQVERGGRVRLVPDRGGEFRGCERRAVGVGVGVGCGLGVVVSCVFGKQHFGAHAAYDGRVAEAHDGAAVRVGERAGVGAERAEGGRRTGVGAEGGVAAEVGVQEGARGKFGVGEGGEGEGEGGVGDSHCVGMGGLW